MYVSRAEAAREALELEQKLMEAQAERELMESAGEIRRTRSIGLEEEEVEESPHTPAQQSEREEATPDRPKNLAKLSIFDLQRVAAADAKLVARLAAKSKNLKGAFQRALRDAAISMQSVVTTLAERQQTEEVLRLEAENRRLREDVAGGDGRAKGGHGGGSSREPSAILLPTPSQGA